VHSIQLTSRAAKQLRRLPEDRRRHVTRVLDELAEGPFRRGRRLKGEFVEFWRARAGEYRIVYTIEADSVTVTWIGPRQSAPYD
jgi:mRNA interferase RelE/StbE